jgi:hypothetical protein
MLSSFFTSCDSSNDKNQKTQKDETVSSIKDNKIDTTNKEINLTTKVIRPQSVDNNDLKPTAKENFSIENNSYKGSKLQQAEYLLRDVKPFAKITKGKKEIPQFLKGILNGEINTPLKSKLDEYLTKNNFLDEEVGGSINDAISKNKKGVKAKYFVIHDTSTPNYKKGDFPKNINATDWGYNDVKKVYNNGKAHVFIGRTGKTYSPNNFQTPYRATKFELKYNIPEEVGKGLFVHIELSQPRKSKEGAWENNDVIAPKPGFTNSQYEKLALLYICASLRAEDWLIPAYHAVMDEGIKNGHDDPQNFQLQKFNDALKKLSNSLK